MSIYKSAQGKSVDMAALAARNEHVRAVGNMPVNARGDTIDANGKIIEPMTKKVAANYQKTVANRATNMTRPIQADPVINKPVENFELLPSEQEFENDDEADEIEAIKAAALKAAEIPTDVVIKSASEAPEFFEPITKKTKR